jgi:hypothetical protein
MLRAKYFAGIAAGLLAGIAEQPQSNLLLTH